ncbi:hypothetical protein JST97_25415 [bacterium]|nr:hypothetical protein [bacterium]
MNIGVFPVVWLQDLGRRCGLGGRFSVLKEWLVAKVWFQVRDRGHGCGLGGRFPVLKGWLVAEVWFQDRVHSCGLWGEFRILENQGFAKARP